VPRRRIGELLVADGALAESAVERALGYQRESRQRVKIGSILLSWELVSEEILLRALASLHHCEPVTGAMLAAAPLEVVRLLSARDAIRLSAIPYAAQRTRIRVGFVDPGDLAAVDEVSALTGRLCIPGVVTEVRLLQAHRRFYGRSFSLDLRPAGPRQAGRPPASASDIGDSESPGGPRRPEHAPPRPSDDTASRRPKRIAVSPARSLPPVATPGGPVPGMRAAIVSPRPGLPTEGQRDLWMQAPLERVPSDLVSGMWTPAEGEAAPTTTPTREELGRLALARIPEALARVVLFAVEEHGQVTGWCGRGAGLDPNRAAAVALSPGPRSVFSQVARSGMGHFGPLSPALWPPELEPLLGASPPPCAVFPVRTARGLSGFLYADRAGATLLYEDFELATEAAVTVAQFFSDTFAPGEETSH
jgi:hypothetical protein